MNMFEQASKEKLRLPSPKGQLTVEQLWDLPLQSKTGFDLDQVARTVNSYLKGAAEESFVNTKTSPEKAQNELALNIVKHIIAAKQEANEATRTSAAKAAEKAKLLEILADKQDESLKGLSVEEIQKRISDLS